MKWEICILAGGLSRRMGRDKLPETISRAFVDRAARRASPLLSELIDASAKR